jgi:4-hydroxy-tetrahydrodipicolinate synthase
MALRIEGTYTALVTPFHDPREKPGWPIDWDALDRLVEAQVAGGVAGLVPCGTTGESPTLSHEEHRQVVERVVKKVGKRVQVIAGAGSNSTRETTELVLHAQRAGADAAMVVVPYYNKPTQEGLFCHFAEVASQASIPIVAYNVPGRTVVELLPDTLARICDAAPNVVAIKEASGNVIRTQQIVSALGDRMVVLCGDDGITLPLIACGARGVISVTSNVLPAEVSRAARLALDGRFDEARRAHLALLPAHDAMFVEASPAPAKAALAMRGLASDAVRSPIVPASEKARAVLASALEPFPARGSR